jgi:hypothetical protein
MGDDGAVAEDLLLEAARAVRPHLYELLPAPEAAEVDRALAEALSREPGEPAHEPGGPDHERVAAILRGSAAVHAWVAEFVTEAVDAPHERYQGLPGDPRPGAPVRYACPEGADFVFYRRSPAIEVPRCPTHQLALTSAC